MNALQNRLRWIDNASKENGIIWIYTRRERRKKRTGTQWEEREKKREIKIEVSFVISTSRVQTPFINGAMWTKILVLYARCTSKRVSSISEKYWNYAFVTLHTFQNASIVIARRHNSNIETHIPDWFDVPVVSLNCNFFCILVSTVDTLPLCIHFDVNYSLQFQYLL